jgi:hypothetical protein
MVLSGAGGQSIWIQAWAKDRFSSAGLAAAVDFDGP